MPTCSDCFKNICVNCSRICSKCHKLVCKFDFKEDNSLGLHNCNWYIDWYCTVLNFHYIFLTIFYYTDHHKWQWIKNTHPILYWNPFDWEVCFDVAVVAVECLDFLFWATTYQFILICYLGSQRLALTSFTIKNSK
jgi:hypothetical protein